MAFSTAAGLTEERDSNAAFLFVWPDGDLQKPAEKLPKVSIALTTRRCLTSSILANSKAM